jgi:hypothetical protein
MLLNAEFKLISYGAKKNPMMREVSEVITNFLRALSLIEKKL